MFYMCPCLARATEIVRTKACVVSSCPRVRFYIHVTCKRSNPANFVDSQNKHDVKGIDLNDARISEVS